MNDTAMAARGKWKPHRTLALSAMAGASFHTVLPGSLSLFTLMGPRPHPGLVRMQPPIGSTPAPAWE